MSEIQATTLADAFNEALAEGRLLIQSCESCGKPNMYPRYRCPFCRSSELGWREAGGAGTLSSFAVVRAVPPQGFEDEVPYAVAVVKLDEGVQLLGRLEPGPDGEWSAYACDARVQFAPRSAEEIARRPTSWFRLTVVKAS